MCKRKRTLISDHYDRIAKKYSMLSKKSRELLPTFPLRAFNNWVKAVLISRTLAHNKYNFVLDLCCGKGGDIGKYSKEGNVSHYIGVDVSQDSVYEAKRRFSTINMKGTVLCGDLLEKNTWDVVLKNIANRLVDVVYMQFAIHYFFESKLTLCFLLSNIASVLRPDGLFVVTTVNSKSVVSCLKNNLTFKGLSFTLSRTDLKREEGSEWPCQNEFGQKYMFTLPGCVEGVQEYLVPIPTLTLLAREQGLRLIEMNSFQSFFTKHRKDINFLKLLEKMHVLDENFAVSKESWELAKMYVIYIFQKIK